MKEIDWVLGSGKLRKGIWQEGSLLECEPSEGTDFVDDESSFFGGLRKADGTANNGADNFRSGTKEEDVPFTSLEIPSYLFSQPKRRGVTSSWIYIRLDWFSIDESKCSNPLWIYWRTKAIENSRNYSASFGRFSWHRTRERSVPLVRVSSNRVRTTKRIEFWLLLKLVENQGDTVREINFNGFGG